MCQLGGGGTDAPPRAATTTQNGLGEWRRSGHRKDHADGRGGLARKPLVLVSSALFCGAGGNGIGPGFETAAAHACAGATCSATAPCRRALAGSSLLFVFAPFPPFSFPRLESFCRPRRALRPPHPHVLGPGAVVGTWRLSPGVARVLTKGDPRVVLGRQLRLNSPSAGRYSPVTPRLFCLDLPLLPRGCPARAGQCGCGWLVPSGRKLAQAPNLLVWLVPCPRRPHDRRPPSPSQMAKRSLRHGRTRRPMTAPAAEMHCSFFALLIPTLPPEEYSGNPRLSIKPYLQNGEKPRSDT